MRGKPRKLPMVKRENPLKRSTTCTKRRQGLFNKVAELVLFCDAKVAVFVSYPSNNNKFDSLGYPSVDSILNLALTGGGGGSSSNAFEGEKEKRAKRVALSLFKDLNKADKTGTPVKKSKKKDAFCWDEFSRELDEIVSLGGDLKTMVDLLRKTKEKASSKLTSLGSSSCNQIQNPVEIINDFTSSVGNDLWGWSYQHETQPAESHPWTMIMPSNPQFVDNAGVFTYQSQEVHQGEVSRSNQDEMNLQGYDDFDVDGLFSFDQDTICELLD